MPRKVYVPTGRPVGRPRLATAAATVVATPPPQRDLSRYPGEPVDELREYLDLYYRPAVGYVTPFREFYIDFQAWLPTIDKVVSWTPTKVKTQLLTGSYGGYCMIGNLRGPHARDTGPRALELIRGVWESAELTPDEQVAIAATHKQASRMPS